MFRCEVWARNGYCKDNYYAGFMATNCNFSCGCTPLAADNICVQLLGPAGDAGLASATVPATCPPAPAGSNSFVSTDGHCCQYVISTPWSCSTFMGATLTGPVLPLTGLCPEPDTTAVNGACCLFRIGALSAGFFNNAPVITGITCFQYSDCPAGNGLQCVNGQCIMP